MLPLHHDPPLQGCTTFDHRRCAGNCGFSDGLVQLEMTLQGFPDGRHGLTGRTRVRARGRVRVGVRACARLKIESYPDATDRAGLGLGLGLELALG